MKKLIEHAVPALAGGAFLAAMYAGCGPVDGTGLDGGANVAVDAGDTTDDRTRCERIKESITASGFSSSVSVECDDDYALITSTTYPSHEVMTGIVGTNDQVPVPAPGYTSPIALRPQLGDQPVSIDAALGVAVNGVPIYDYSSQGNLELDQYDPAADTTLNGELDVCNGHSGRGDDYHYHAKPVCMIAAMDNVGPETILGWGFDGYPLFGDTNPDGSDIASGDLDLCNAQADETYGMRYHTSSAPPYIMQCLVGEVDLAIAPRVRKMEPPEGGGAKADGTKPPGGVTNLVHVELSDGVRRMTYDHQGTSYSIEYAPSATPDCWDFKESSFTTGGQLLEATYCRGAM